MLYTQGCTDNELYARLYRPCIGPAPYAGLFKYCTIRRAVQILHYMQGCTVLTLYAWLGRPYTIHRAVQAQHYTQGSTCPAQYAGLCMLCALRIKGLCSFSTINRSVQVLHYTQACAGPSQYAGLYRPYSICRAV